ncbi:MAG: hypothetical protein PH343_05300 [Nitrospira sp.]|nr:hypothetical protein [Nitrospira sp.]
MLKKNNMIKYSPHPSLYPLLEKTERVRVRVGIVNMDVRIYLSKNHAI